MLPLTSLTRKTHVEVHVGALVLELKNEQLARFLLENHATKSAVAAMFFDEHDELTTIDEKIADFAVGKSAL